MRVLPARAAHREKVVAGHEDGKPASGKRGVNCVGVVADVNHDVAVRKFSFDAGKPPCKTGRKEDVFVDIAKPFGRNSVLQDAAQIAARKNRLDRKSRGFQPGLDQIPETKHAFLAIKRIISDEDDDGFV
jgi:hypothetical protein